MTMNNIAYAGGTWEVSPASNIFTLGTISDTDDDLALFDSNKISINANRDYLTLPIGKYEFIYGSHLDTDSTNISISFEFMMVPSNVQPDITGANGTSIRNITFKTVSGNILRSISSIHILDIMEETRLFLRASRISTSGMDPASVKTTFLIKELLRAFDIQSITQVDYDALAMKDPNTLYLIDNIII